MQTLKILIKYSLRVLLVLFLLCNIYIEHNTQFAVTIPYKIAFAAGFIGLWTAVSFLLSGQMTHMQRKKRMQRYLAVLFIYYIWILANMLFFDAAFGRTREALPDPRFYAASVNLKPFATIYTYIKAYSRGTVNRFIIATNLLGNLAAFAPMGFFLPVFWRPMRRIWLFVPTVALTVCAVELLQIHTMTGSCDIDDVILNTLGALVFWLVIQLPPVRRLVYGFTGQERKEIA